VPIRRHLTAERAGRRQVTGGYLAQQDPAGQKTAPVGRVVVLRITEALARLEKLMEVVGNQNGIGPPDVPLSRIERAGHVGQYVNGRHGGRVAGWE
jgi:hypothetical protein